MLRCKAACDLEQDDDGALTASEARRAAHAEAGRDNAAKVALGLDDGDLCQARARVHMLRQLFASKLVECLRCCRLTFDMRGSWRPQAGSCPLDRRVRRQYGSRRPLCP